MFTILDGLRGAGFEALIFKLFLAILIPSVLGIERERTHDYSSLSTYALVTLGATLTMTLSLYETALFAGPWGELANAMNLHVDASRIGAQVINGIGFLGAGTIIVTGGKDVKGLTTAAGLWSSACLGLAIGVGFFECAIIGFVIMFITMHFLPALQHYVVMNAKRINLYVEISDVRAVSTIVTATNNIGGRIIDVEINKMALASGDEFLHPSLNILIHVPRAQQRIDIISCISQLEQVIAIEEL